MNCASMNTYSATYHLMHICMHYFLHYFIYCSIVDLQCGVSIRCIAQ